MNAHTTVFSAPGVEPVALLRELGLEGQAPVVLLDSAGGSAELTRRHYLAWEPVFRLRVRRGVVEVTPGPATARDAQARALAERASALTTLPPFEALRAATRLAAEAAPARNDETGDGLAPADRRAPAAADFPEAGALFGLIAYDAVRYLERLPDSVRDDLGLPDIDVFLPGRLLRLDVATGEAVFLDRLAGREVGRGEADAGEPGAEDAAAAQTSARVGEALQRARRGAAATLHSNDMPVFRSNFTRPEYEAVVARTREYVYAGDIFQANLSQRLDGMYALPSLHLYATLRAVNPSPIAGYLHCGDYELISSSPERLVSLGLDGWAETRPIAGTRPRGSRGPEDDAMAEELNLDPKDRAEHIMLVDLERNDLGRVCEYGTVRVSELMVNEYYSHVIHIVSNVRGHLHPSRDSVDLIRAMFPGGTITGCPKVRCMEIIDELETVRRGPYTGSFGWIAERALDLNIVIRTLVRVGDRLFLQVGGGIVADSVPEREFNETLHKAQGMLRAVSAGIAERPG
jgi:anthranilate/para-aminobenzoate synthase component I